MKKMLLLIMICMLILLSACEKTAKPTSEDRALCIIAGNHANSKGINYSNKMIDDEIYSTISSYGIVHLIRLDGEPELIFSEDYNETIPPHFRGASPSKLEADYKVFKKNVIKLLEETRAKYNEVSTLESLQLAARIFSDLKTVTKKTIIIADTGLSTSGILNFRNNLLDADPDMIAKTLSDKLVIPNLSDVKVIWVGLGDTEMPQQKLSAERVVKLKKIWTAIIENAGGEVVFSEHPNKNTLTKELPSVSPVQISPEEPIQFEPTSIKKESFLSPVIMDESRVAFVPDQAVFLDEEKALGSLRAVVDCIKDTDVSLLLIGSTAGDADSSESRLLSLNRSYAVKKALTDLGISEHRLIAVGLGSFDPWHISGLELDSPLSAQNRKVVLIDANTEIAREILSRETNIN